MIREAPGNAGELALSPDSRAGCAPHYHHTYAIRVVHSGEGLLFALGELWPVNLGDIVITNPFDVHWLRVGAAGLRDDIFYPNPGWIAALNLNDPARSFFATPVICDPKLVALFVAAMENASTCDDSDLRSVVSNLFTRHATRWPASENGGAAFELVERTRQLIDARDGNVTRIGDLSLCSDVSRAYLSREFSRSIGLSPLEYRRQARVIAARELIANGAALAEAADAVGFADQAHMTRQFRALLGFTPKAFRPAHLR